MLLNEYYSVLCNSMKERNLQDSNIFEINKGREGNSSSFGLLLCRVVIMLFHFPC